MFDQSPYRRPFESPINPWPTPSMRQLFYNNALAAPVTPGVSETAAASIQSAFAEDKSEQTRSVEELMGHMDEAQLQTAFQGVIDVLKEQLDPLGEDMSQALEIVGQLPDEVVVHFKMIVAARVAHIEEARCRSCSDLMDAVIEERETHLFRMWDHPDTLDLHDNWMDLANKLDEELGDGPDEPAIVTTGPLPPVTNDVQEPSFEAMLAQANLAMLTDGQIVQVVESTAEIPENSGSDNV